MINIKVKKKTEESISQELEAVVTAVQGVGSLVSAEFQKTIITREYVKGIIVDWEDERTVIDIYINVSFGTKIPQTAFAIQEAVKKTTVDKFDIKNIKVNIHVQGIDF